MEWISYIVAFLFCLVGAACLVLIVVSLPGLWIMVALALVIELVDGMYLPVGARQTFPWWLLIASIVLAGIAELVELAAGAEGARRGGAGRRGIIGALIGGIVGAIVFTGLLPFPLVGTLIGALIGSFVGAMLGEMSGVQPKQIQHAVGPAAGATIGRLAGTVGKLIFAVAIWLALSVAAFWK